MEYGLIGKKLSHSFSRDIHTKLNKFDYSLVEIAESDLDSFMEERNFKAINVTMPYKERVIKHLGYVDERALKIGAVNTVVNRDGKLYGYNTDFSGMVKMLDKFNISAVSEGQDTLGEVTLKLQSGGKTYSGRGLSTDIIEAGIMAYLNAINKLMQ